MSSRFIHVTVKQDPNTRKASQVYDDREIYLPITSIGYVKFFRNEEYEVFLRSDINLEKSIGYNDYKVFGTKKDLEIE